MGIWFCWGLLVFRFLVQQFNRDSGAGGVKQVNPVGRKVKRDSISAARATRAMEFDHEKRLLRCKLNMEISLPSEILYDVYHRFNSTIDLLTHQFDVLRSDAD